MQLGVRAGVHWATFRTHNPNLGWSFGSGYVIALPIQIPLKNRWSIRLEPSVIQKGWRTKVTYTLGPTLPEKIAITKMQYEVAELPLLLVYRQKITNRIACYSQAGPSIGYITGGRYKISNDGSEIFNQKIVFSRRIETGIWGGGGMEVLVGQLTTFLDVRYQYGFGKYPTAGLSGVDGTHGFTVSVGCWLPTKK
ncbi:hypothetical protein GCM10028804_36700 [Larkinella terrae]